MASIFCCEYLEVEDMIFELVGVLVLEAADTAADDTTEKNIKVKFHNAEKTSSKNEGALTALYLKKMMDS